MRPRYSGGKITKEATGDAMSRTSLEATAGTVDCKQIEQGVFGDLPPQQCAKKLRTQWKSTWQRALW